MSDAHHFAISSSWNPELKEGTIWNESRSLHATHTGAAALGGRGGHTNPEELLLAAVSSCFVQTWVIFLGKLNVPIENLMLDATCRVEPDPAGGFHVTQLDLHPHVPAALWESRRADIEKTLSLAEKYCIISKAVKREGRVTVTAKPV